MSLTDSLDIVSIDSSEKDIDMDENALGST